MKTLRDKARELVSVAEGEIQKREITIVSLRHVVERLKKELAEAKRLQLTNRPPKCEHCVYRIVASKALKAEEAAKSEGGLSDARK